MGQKSGRARTSSGIFLLKRKKAVAKPSILTNGQEVTKTFQRKMFHTETTAEVRGETRTPLIPSSFTT